MRRTAGQLAQIITDGADIGTATALDGHQHAMARHFSVHGDGFHMHLAQGYLDGFTPSGTLVHGHAVLLDGTVHAGPLKDIALQLLGSLADRLIGRVILAGLNDHAGGVLGVSGSAKGSLRDIGLFLIHQIVEQPRRTPNHNGQHTCGLRVEGAGMANPLLPREALHHSHNGRAGHSRGLEDIQKSVHSVFSSSSFIRATTRVMASSSVPCTVAPAA